MLIVGRAAVPKHKGNAMTRTLALATVCGLTVATVAFGNAGPAPLPKNRKVAEPPVKFEGVEKATDYVFYLRYSVLYQGSTLVEVKDSGTLKLDLKFKDRIPNVNLMVLLAVERKEFEKRKKADPKLDWLTIKTDGVLAVEVPPPPTTVPADAKETPTTTYRVAIKDGKLIAEKVENKQATPKDKEPVSLLPTWAIGVVCSLSVAWLGVWFSRRAAPADPSRGA